MRRLAHLILFLLLAEGCGIKGPLYIPTPEQKQQAEARKQRREAAMRRDAGEPPAGKPDTATATAAPEPADATAASPILQPGEDAFGLSTPTQYPPLP